jgi:hypothetical protein
MLRGRVATRVVAVCIGTLVGIGILASCASRLAGVASASGVGSAAPTAEAVAFVVSAEGDFPAALVGTWSGDGSKSLTFTSGGLYYGNLGEGRAVVSGNRITLTPLRGIPVETTWSVDGGRLYLGTSVWLRDDAGSGSLSLVGMWYAVNGYARFRFNAEGTYDFADPSRSLSSTGTYAVAGQVLTISPRDQPSATFGLSYDGTTLTFLKADGTSAGEYLRVG